MGTKTDSIFRYEEEGHHVEYKIGLGLIAIAAYYPFNEPPCIVSGALCFERNQMSGI